MSTSNRKILETGKIDTPDTCRHDQPLSWVWIKKNGAVKLVLWTQRERNLIVVSLRGQIFHILYTMKILIEVLV
jgi:hypothetical protein